MARKGFTLIEMMVVVLIIGILAAAMIPFIATRIDSAKWAEANSMAGTIRTATRVYFIEKGPKITGSLSDAAIQTALDFTAADLTGTYFAPGDYTIDSVDDNGNAQITVTASKPNAPKGSKTLKADGSWK
jgi:prepilin-type N-terminal cleavage/methylation domain-containing protein